jgi:hypothetical protein
VLAPRQVTKSPRPSSQDLVTSHTLSSVIKCSGSSRATCASCCSDKLEMRLVCVCVCDGQLHEVLIGVRKRSIEHRELASFQAGPRPGCTCMHAWCLTFELVESSYLLQTGFADPSQPRRDVECIVSVLAVDLLFWWLCCCDPPRLTVPGNPRPT